MQTLLVTGGAGFIGCNFVRLALRDPKRRVVVLDKLTYAGSLENLRAFEGNPRCSFEHGDIADADFVRETFEKHQPDAVLNFAAESHVDRSIDGPGVFVRTNVVGTFVLLEAARTLLEQRDDEARSAFRFLHVSTDEVFGSLGAEGLFSEETPYDPSSPYSASKAAADHLARAYERTYGLPVLVTNCSNNFGPFQFPEKLIPVMILNAVAGKPLPIYGRGENVRDWLHVEDHCRGLLTVLDQGMPGESYNLGGEQEKTNLEVVDAICHILDRVHPPTENPNVDIESYSELKEFVEDRPGHDLRYAIDPRKIHEELGWRAERTFEQGLEETVRWYLDHTDWCSAVLGGEDASKRRGLSGAAQSGPS